MSILSRDQAALYNSAVKYFEGSPMRSAQDMYVWRGMRDPRELTWLGAGDASFIATSRIPTEAFRFAKQSDPREMTPTVPRVLRIKVPAGTPIMPVGKGHDEIQEPYRPPPAPTPTFGRLR